ncbi:MAG: efflux RND transporter periplasmic adaptor subunit [Pseudomonadales bacterium]|nr:efflux RND transporter periplasmic adaptor subunit [Pseudomonadales bacterium]MCP5356795.1 efflux RND transporter periplasmic adaptor subunit [Pseudomonadales bacterium]
MSPRLLSVLSLTLLSAIQATASAQEMIQISDEDIARMGVVFSPVALSGNNAGNRFPATVVNSPELATTLSPTVAGRIEQWHYQPGATVAAGAILATLRSQEILAQQNAWIEAVTALENAEFMLRKDQSLYDTGVISQQRLNQTRQQQAQAAFAERSARTQLQHAGFNNARLQALREQGQGLGFAYLLAPTATQLSQRLADTGSYIEAGTPLATLSSGEHRWVSLHVPARLAMDLQIGQGLTLADGAATLTLRQMDYAVDSSNQTIELMAEFDTDSSAMTGQLLSVVLPPARDGLLIPDRAVVHSGNETTVYVRTPNGVEARVLTLRSVGADYLAENGIREGEQVAIQGTAVLKGIQLGLGGGE